MTHVIESDHLPGSYTDQIPHAEVRAGFAAVRAGEHETARTHFTRALESDPDDCYALVGLGDLERKDRATDAALSYYARCLAIDPDNHFALFGTAEALRFAERYEQAAEAWERYLDTHDAAVQVLTRAADCNRKARNTRRAEELYREVLDREPENPYALTGLGHLQYRTRNYHGALGSWQRVYERDRAGVDVRILTSIGNCYRKLYRYHDGLHFFEAALELERDNFYALYGLADCYRGLRKPKRSLEYWGRILESDPNNRIILTRTGDGYRTLGSSERAAEYYRRALQQGFDEYALLGLALLDREAGDFEKAETQIRALAAKAPGNARVHVELARTLQELDAVDEAIRTLETFISRNPGSGGGAAGRALVRMRSPQA